MSRNSPLSGSGKASITAQYLRGVQAVIVQQGLGKTRASILSKQLARHGGKESSKLNQDTTHILVGNSVKLSRLPALLKVKEISQNTAVVRADWLSSCLKVGKLVDLGPFALNGNEVCQTEGGTSNVEDITKSLSGNTKGKRSIDAIDDLPSVPCKTGDGTSPGSSERDIPTTSQDVSVAKRRKIALDDDDDSDYVDSDDDTEEDGTDSAKDGEEKPTEISPHISPHKKGDKWICTKPSTSKQENLNQNITEKLEVLERVYKNSNDQWRALGYKKAIASIKDFPKKIETLEECKGLPFVGERLANKIWEIVQTGHLRRLENLDPKTNSVDLFCNLWGAGPKTAETWVAKGLKTLDDLKEHGNLNRQQQIGLKYYDEFLERMPRSEAEEIGNVVMKAAHDLDPDLQCVICGSFRRGRTTCGDVDVLVSHPDGRSHLGVMGRLLEKLRENGFLTDDLSLTDNQKQRKYFGVCLLPGEDRKHRRLDIIVVPYSEWICSLIYFTGSDYLNRSMRLLARKKGMSLSEHSLNTGVIRKGQERLTEGTPLTVAHEKDVFKYLGLDYLEPHERDW
ncbi:DNA polymerase lambda-like [Dendronephthya gigantea]|uniref:DNA polymerase lambda-like n=1 Tax=Dendronephthya gigantea TaxID=151771 RepID=UPI00106B3DCA|nr:DNA polymerase lambda-like [Dendronephthya gigantea]